MDFFPFMGSKGMSGPPAMSFGEELRRERVVREISLEEISAATKISVRLLHALEDSDLAKLPAPTFTRGFIRAYARHLGIDPEEKVNAYLADLAGFTDPTSPKRPRPRSRFFRGRRATAGTIVGGVTGLLLLLGLIANPDRRTPAARERIPARAVPVSLKNVTASSEPTPVIRLEPVPAPPAEAPPASAVSLLLEFDGDSWTKIEADGQIVLSGLVHRGESKRFEARSGFRLTLGNAGAVRVTVDGRALDRLGEAGQVVRDLPLPGGPARG